jgi:hypothetical protein
VALAGNFFRLKEMSFMCCHPWYGLLLNGGVFLCNAGQCIGFGFGVCIDVIPTIKQLL